MPGGSSRTAANAQIQSTFTEYLILDVSLVLPATAMDVGLEHPEQQANGNQSDNEGNHEHLLMMVLARDCGRILGCFRFVSQFNFPREMGQAILILGANHPLPAVALALDVPVRFALGNHIANNVAQGPPAVRAARVRAINMLTGRIPKAKMSLLWIFFPAAGGSNPDRGRQIRQHRKRLAKWYGLSEQRHFLLG
jgi:hypothetical protein